MPEYEEFTEEEYTSRLDSKTFRRILKLLAPHKSWVFGFLLTIAIVSILDGYFTFLNKKIIDEAIIPRQLVDCQSKKCRMARILLLSRVILN